MLMDSSLTIGQRFKHIRVEKGLSQSDVAEGVCSKTVVSHLENDRQYPSAIMLGKLADKLGVPLREIMGMQEQQFEAGFRIDMISVYIEKSDYEHALKHIEDLSGNDNLLEHQITELFVYHVDCLNKTGKYHEAVHKVLPFLEAQEANKSVSEETLCILYNKLGRAYFNLNDFERAFSSFQQGYRISLKFGTFNIVAARVTKNLGLVCNQLGYKQDARKYLEKAYQFYESSADLTGIADTLFALAVASGDGSYLAKAKAIYESQNLIHEANVVKQHFAFHVESKRSYLAAVEKLQSSAKEFERLGDYGMGVYTLSRAAVLCIENEDAKSAQEILGKAEVYKGLMKNEDPFMLGLYYIARSKLSLLVREFDDCIHHANIASELCAIMGMYADSADAQQMIANAYRLQGNVDQAYEVMVKVAHLLRESQRRNSV